MGYTPWNLKKKKLVNKKAEPKNGASPLEFFPTL